jgi:protein-disulfide isomerase
MLADHGHWRSLRHLAGALVVVGFLVSATASRAQVGQSPSAAVKSAALSLAGIPQHDETLGRLTAPVRMLYFDDPQSPISRMWHARVLPLLVRRYVKPGKLQIQWHGYAVIGPDSVTGERFTAAAGLQDHLWDVLDSLMVNQGEENTGWLNPLLLERIGESIPGLDVAAAMSEAGSPAISHELAMDRMQGDRAGLRGVPFMEIGRRGGRLRQLGYGVWTRRELEPPIDRLLRKK